MISSAPLMKLHQLVDDLGKARLAGEVGERQAVHGARALVDLALGVQVAVEMTAARAAIEQLDAADLDDAVAARGLEAGGFGIQYDLTHGRLV